MKEWPEQPAKQYLKSCENRIQTAQDYVCEIISNEVGHPIMINPLICAQCMVFGKPNEQFLKKQIKHSLQRLLTYVPLHFYETKRVEEIIRKVYNSIEDDDERGLIQLGRVMIACVETGALSLETAEEMTKDMPRLEKLQ